MSVVVVKQEAINIGNLVFPKLAEEFKKAQKREFFFSREFIRSAAKELYLELLKSNDEFMWAMNVEGTEALTTMGLHKWVDIYGDGGSLSNAFYADPDPSFSGRFDKFPALDYATKQPVAESPLSNYKPVVEAVEAPVVVEDIVAAEDTFDIEDVAGRVTGVDDEPFMSKTMEELQKEMIVASEIRQNLAILNTIASSYDQRHLSATTAAMIRQDTRLYIDALRALTLGNFDVSEYEEIADGELV